MRQIAAPGLTLIKKWEGVEDGNPSTVNLDPYLDPLGIWTIGWGHAILDIHKKLLRGPAMKTQAYALYPLGLTYLQAETLLLADSLEASKNVEALARVPLTDNQFDALVSFQFNTGALRGSTLLKKLNAKDYAGAAAQFERWTKGHDAHGNLVELPGLVQRRAAERMLFQSTR